MLTLDGLRAKTRRRVLLGRMSYCFSVPDSSEHFRPSRDEAWRDKAIYSRADAIPHAAGLVLVCKMLGDGEDGLGRDAFSLDVL